MRKELHDAYNHLQVIKGVSYGLISDEDVAMVCSRYALSKDDAAGLVFQLQNEGIILRTAIEKDALLNEYRKKHEPATGNKRLASDRTEEIVPLSDEQLLEKAVRINMQEFSIDASVMALRAGLCGIDTPKKQSDIPKVCARTMVDLGCRRTRKALADKGESGWICGTLVGHIREDLQWFLSKTYSLERLESLLFYCKSNDADDPIMEGVLICLAADEVPRIPAIKHKMKNLYA